MLKRPQGSSAPGCYSSECEELTFSAPRRELCSLRSSSIIHSQFTLRSLLSQALAPGPVLSLGPTPAWPNLAGLSSAQPSLAQIKACSA